MHKLSHQGPGTRAQGKKPLGPMSAVQVIPAEAQHHGVEKSSWSFYILFKSQPTELMQPKCSGGFTPLCQLPVMQQKWTITGPALPSISWSSLSELLFQGKEEEGIEVVFVLGCPVALCFLSSDCWKTGVSNSGWEPLANTSC